MAPPAGKLVVGLDKGSTTAQTLAWLQWSIFRLRVPDDSLTSAPARECCRSCISSPAENSWMLKREVDASAGHTEIVVSSIDDVPSEVVDNSDMQRKPHFESAAELPHSFRPGTAS